MSYADIVKKNIPASESKDAPGYEQITESKNVAKTVDSSSEMPLERKLHFVDAGANLANKTFNDILEKTLDQAVENGISKILIVANSLVESEKVIKLCRKYNDKYLEDCAIYCTVGVQPHESERVLKDKKWIDKLEALISKNRDIVVAVGKCGLDYNRMFSSKPAQITVFESQIQLANKYDLPILLHERDAFDDFYNRLFQHKSSLKKIIHCFIGDDEKVSKYLDRNCYLSLTGIICDRRLGEEMKSAMSTLPLERTLIATDSPKLMPPSLRNRKNEEHNSPKNASHITIALARHLRMKYEDVCDQLMKNFDEVYLQKQE